MRDQPNEPVDLEGEPDPAVTAGLRSMPVPSHGSGFWAEVDAQVGANASMGTVRPTPPQLPPPFPPPPEVTPLATSASGFPRWLAMAAAAVVVVAALGTVALARRTSTDVETTAATSTLPVEPTALVTTTLLPSSTLTTARPATAPVTTPKPTAPSTSAPPTVVRSPFTVTPEGVGPIRIGMTGKQTEATGAVGPATDPLDNGGQCMTAGPAGTTYTTDDFSALFLEGRLARLYVGSSRMRTPEGVGTGSASSKLKAIPGTRTERPHPYGGGTNIDIMRGNVGYQFTVDQGRVTEWSVGTRDGLSLPEGCA